MTTTDEGAGEAGAAGPLHGVRVVEVSMYVQAPVTGLALAGLGADVVKIEQVGRDDFMRTASALYGVPLDDRGRDWLWAALNRGKRTLALDVTADAGRRVLHRLIASADVFVTNLREEALARLGLDPATLCGVNPRLVYAKGGGFTASGPLAGLPCQDTVGMAYGGLMDLTSSTGEPNYPPGGLSDVLTGTMLASAIMAGLVQRATTGRGGVVGATQTQSLLWLQLLPVGMAGSIGATMPRFSTAAPANPLFHVYPAEDGWISIACIMGGQWPPAARALGLEHLLEDERFATWDGVLANAEELAAIIARTTPQRTKAAWWEVLREHGVWSAPVNDVHDVVADGHLRHDAYLPEYPDGFVAPRAPFEVGDWRQTTTTAAAYGQHTDEVLAELGLDAHELEELRVNGTIW
ncbi:MAG: hypothetical protein GEV08_19005 [Acidimicrobiia bacterium]|nr:hypothetical protein [Acidimicrobiia bacterium]